MSRLLSEYYACAQIMLCTAIGPFRTLSVEQVFTHTHTQNLVLQVNQFTKDIMVFFYFLLLSDQLRLLKTKCNTVLLNIQK